MTEELISDLSTSTLMIPSFSCIFHSCVRMVVHVGVMKGLMLRV